MGTMVSFMSSMVNGLYDNMNEKNEKTLDKSWTSVFGTAVMESGLAKQMFLFTVQKTLKLTPEQSKEAELLFDQFYNNYYKKSQLAKDQKKADDDKDPFQPLYALMLPQDPLHQPSNQPSLRLPTPSAPSAPSVPSSEHLNKPKTRKYSPLYPKLPLPKSSPIIPPSKSNKSSKSNKEKSDDKLDSYIREIAPFGCVKLAIDQISQPMLTSLIKTLKENPTCSITLDDLLNPETSKLVPGVSAIIQFVNGQWHSFLYRHSAIESWLSKQSVNPANQAQVDSRRDLFILS